MLVRSDRRPIDMVQAPIECALDLCLVLQGGEYSVPHPRFDPAIEARGDSLPGTILSGKVTPGSTCAQDPQDAIDDQAMVFGRATGLGFLRR